MSRKDVLILEMIICVIGIIIFFLYVYMKKIFVLLKNNRIYCKNIIFLI